MNESVYSQLLISQILMSQSIYYIKDYSLNTVPFLFMFQLILSETTDISK